MTYSDEEIKDRLGKYGSVYLPEEIIESVDDILGNRVKKERLEDFFKALKKYEDMIEQLKKTKLNPNLTVLLYGPPGTGKTSLTRAFSKKYKIPICVVESDRLVSPLLGDTIKNIRNVVELSADIAEENGAFILFFDEIDAIGSERSNIHEVGEIKRAVISFLQVIDKINYEGVPLAIFGATNHQHQLDSAIWRRFTFHLKFDFPDYELRKTIIESFLKKIEDADIGVDDSIYDKLDIEIQKIQKIHRQLEAKLGREISEFDDNLLWNEVNKKSDINGLLKLTIGYSGSDIERGTRVALFKVIHTGIMTYNIFYNSLQLVGGTAVHVQTQDVLSASSRSERSSERYGNDTPKTSGPPEI
ncbi:MAG: AAA family ATPase [Candidatus Lokiarchaeota archaeon]|nr:AAA family ATPase [Candidatus Lokiarchaeota archaeon]MBD3202214.1 AAA family ATPase [Candidatus Lokiarchaeota archaeon]